MPRRMRDLRGRLAAAGLALALLSGCAAGQQPASTAAPSPAAPNARPAIARCTPATAQGCYHSDIYYGAGASICYLDYETMQDVVLCASPSCAHDSDACPAFYPFDGRTLLGGVQVAGDTLLALQTVPGDTTVPHIDRLGLDGSYQGCLAEFGAGQQLPGNIETDYYTDSSFLYFVLNDVDSETARRSGRVVSVSLDSGEVRTVYESPEVVTQLTIFTAFDRSLVLYEVQAESLSEVSERIFVRDIDTGAEQEIDWRSDDTTATMANGRYLWTVDEAAQTLTRLDLADHTALQCSLAGLYSQAQQQYGEVLESYVSPLSFTDDACFVEFSVPDQDGGRHPAFYIVRLSDGSAVPFTLYKTFNQTVMQVVAQTPRGLLVQKDWLSVPSGDSETYYPQWALISPEDYLRSDPKWIAAGQLELGS